MGEFIPAATSTNNETTTIDTEERPDLVVKPVSPIASSDECPIEQPESFETNCTGHPADKQCDYGYIYMGCSWDELRCSPTAFCDCAEEGLWACAVMDLGRCGSFDSEQGLWVDDPIPEGLPWGESCDPNEPLPTMDEECPVEAPVSFETNCTEYPLDKQCNYDYVYMGCSWDELQCSATQFCQCSEDETWACAMASPPLCEELPKDLPLGESCDPDEPLPTAPPSNEGEDPVDGRVEDECPPDLEFGSCAGYESGQVCEYGHMYTGCTWEDLACVPIQTCTCDEFGDGDWACLSFRRLAMLPCSETLPGHPFGQGCDPSLPLPVPPETSGIRPETERVGVVGEIADGAMP